MANKCDTGGYLKSQQRSFIESEKIKYFITSAKTGKNVESSML